MNYIHQESGWPQFAWDSEALTGPLAAVRHAQGKHLGRMENLGFEIRSEANLEVLTSEVVKSSAIEGEALDPREFRSSGARCSPDVVLRDVRELTDRAEGLDMRAYVWHIQSPCRDGRTAPLHRVRLG